MPAAIILVGPTTESARHTVFTCVAITHLGGIGTWIALLLLANESAIGDSTAHTQGSGIQAVIALGIGFGGALALAGVAIQIVGHALEIQPRVCAPSRR